MKKLTVLLLMALLGSTAHAGSSFSTQFNAPASADVDGSGTRPIVHPYCKMEFGADGTRTQVSGSNPFPVTVISGGSSVLYPPLQFLDTNKVIDASSPNIPASASSALSIVSSLNQAVSKIRIWDSTGKFMDLYDNSTLILVIAPGENDTQDVPTIASGHAIKIKADPANPSAITSGNLLLIFK